MKPVLVIYATREGHTRHIAEHLAAALNAHQRSCDLVDAAHVPEEFSVTKYCGAIVSASLHGGKHETEMVKFVKRHLAELQQIPTVFLSVSLSEVTAEDEKASPEKRAEAQADVKRTIESFLAETGWQPSHIAAVGGALMYSRYNFAIRFVMKLIARKAGAPVDTTRDYEFTDWTKLDRLVDEFIASTPTEIPATAC
ncbi:MAG: flavodoxin domain-containing protein [Bryobacteraceae bacterium]|jgi:menaquinone-dependent protoporphyrinogen oxidase